MKINEYFEKIQLSKEVIAIAISITSLLVFALGFYVSNLKPPEISFVTAP